MKKKILYITAFVPSGIGAGENFSRQLINKIAEGHAVDLIFFRYSYDADYVIENKNVRVLKVFRNSLFIKLLNFLSFPLLFPLFTVRFNWVRLIYLRKILKTNDYGLAIFDFSQTFIYAKFISGVPVILNCHDIIAQRYSRIYRGVMEPFVRRSESLVLKGDNVKIFNHSAKDSDLLYSLYSIRSEVTSVFIDHKVIGSVPDLVGDYFVFFANWKRADNSVGLSWFFTNVYPFLRPGIRIKIIGSGLPEAINSLIRKNSAIEYLGFMKDPYKVISNSSALISPLFTGAGIKVKVIDSLACGTKVIGTPIAFEGIPAAYEGYMVKAFTADEFISAINEFSTSIDEKLVLKNLFINTYTDYSIIRYIDRTL